MGLLRALMAFSLFFAESFVSVSQSTAILASLPPLPTSMWERLVVDLVEACDMLDPDLATCGAARDAAAAAAAGAAVLLASAAALSILLKAKLISSFTVFFRLLLGCAGTGILFWAYFGTCPGGLADGVGAVAAFDVRNDCFSAAAETGAPGTVPFGTETKFFSFS